MVVYIPSLYLYTKSTHNLIYLETMCNIEEKNMAKRTAMAKAMYDMLVARQKVIMAKAKA